MYIYLARSRETSEVLRPSDQEKKSFHITLKTVKETFQICQNYTRIVETLT